MESDIKLLIESRREKQKYFSEKFLMRLLTQVSSVLRYIHSKSVLHRDISPDNIMIKSFKEGDEDSLMVVLSDFDTVREHEGTLMNKTNLVGKRFYAAPEMAGSTYGTPIDIWSLGVVMIELMTFSPMFHFRPFTEVILDEISQEQVLGTLAAEMRVCLNYNTLTCLETIQ
jgi:serine/threonine protein kinase